MTGPSGGASTGAAALGAAREWFIVGLLVMVIAFICLLLAKWTWDWGRWKMYHSLAVGAAAQQQQQQAIQAPPMQTRRGGGGYHQ